MTALVLVLVASLLACTWMLLPKSPSDEPDNDESDEPDNDESNMTAVQFLWKGGGLLRADLMPPPRAEGGMLVLVRALRRVKWAIRPSLVGS